MEATMVNNLINTLEGMKGKPLNLWVHGVFSLPIVVLEDFDWWFQETDDGEEFLILSGGENSVPITTDEIFDVYTDGFTSEAVIYFTNMMVLQLWTDLE